MDSTSLPTVCAIVLLCIHSKGLVCLCTCHKLRCRFHIQDGVNASGLDEAYVATIVLRVASRVSCMQVAPMFETTCVLRVRVGAEAMRKRVSLTASFTRVYWRWFLCPGGGNYIPIVLGHFKVFCVSEIGMGRMIVFLVCV